MRPGAVHDSSVLCSTVPCTSALSVLCGRTSRDGFNFSQFLQLRKKHRSLQLRVEGQWVQATNRQSSHGQPRESVDVLRRWQLGRASSSMNRRRKARLAEGTAKEMKARYELDRGLSRTVPQNHDTSSSNRTLSCEGLLGVVQCVTTQLET